MAWDDLTSVYGQPVPRRSILADLKFRSRNPAMCFSIDSDVAHHDKNALMQELLKGYKMNMDYEGSNFERDIVRVENNLVYLTKMIKMQEDEQSGIATMQTKVSLASLDKVFDEYTDFHGGEFSGSTIFISQDKFRRFTANPDLAYQEASNVFPDEYTPCELKDHSHTYKIIARDGKNVITESGVHDETFVLVMESDNYSGW